MSAQENLGEMTKASGNFWKNQQHHHPFPKSLNKSWNGTQNRMGKTKQCRNETHKTAVPDTQGMPVGMNEPGSNERSKPENHDEPDEQPKLSKTAKDSAQGIQEDVSQQVKTHKHHRKRQKLGRVNRCSSSSRRCR